MVANRSQHGTQVFEIEQEKTIVVGNFEGKCEDALLGIIEVKNAAQEKRSHFRDRGTHRMALLAEYIPESHWEAGKVEVFEAELRDPLRDPGIVSARAAEPGQITLYIRHEYGYADAAEPLGHDAQRHCLACSGSPGSEPVPVSHLRQKAEIIRSPGNKYWICHSWLHASWLV